MSAACAFDEPLRDLGSAANEVAFYREVAPGLQSAVPVPVAVHAGGTDFHGAGRGDADLVRSRFVLVLQRVDAQCYRQLSPLPKEHPNSARSNNSSKKDEPTKASDTAAAGSTPPQDPGQQAQATSSPGTSDDQKPSMASLSDLPSLF